jgi:Na+-transporting methylmalonyl-CoA/oxaloacetate decarboxylase beta subunit
MLIMIAISLVLIWLAIAKGFEPLLTYPYRFRGDPGEHPFCRNR